MALCPFPLYLELLRLTRKAWRLFGLFKSQSGEFRHWKVKMPEDGFCCYIIFVEFYWPLVAIHFLYFALDIKQVKLKLEKRVFGRVKWLKIITSGQSQENQITR